MISLINLKNTDSEKFYIVLNFLKKSKVATVLVVYIQIIVMEKKRKWKQLCLTQYLLQMFLITTYKKCSVLLFVRTFMINCFVFEKRALTCFNACKQFVHS